MCFYTSKIGIFCIFSTRFKQYTFSNLILYISFELYLDINDLQMMRHLDMRLMKLCVECTLSD